MKTTCQILASNSNFSSGSANEVDTVIIVFGIIINQKQAAFFGQSRIFFPMCAYANMAPTILAQISWCGPWAPLSSVMTYGPRAPSLLCNDLWAPGPLSPL